MPGTANRVLVVDDEPPLLKMVSTYLRRLGYVVVTAGSTEQAWKEVEAAPHTFAVAVLDATMSGMRMEDLAAQHSCGRSPALRDRGERVSCGHQPTGGRCSGQGDVSAQTVFAGDAGPGGPEDDCHAKRRRLTPARK